MASKTRVLGARETVDNLKRIGERLRERIVRDACRAAADVFAKRIAATTYGEGRKQRTGLLLASQAVRTRVAGDLVQAAVYMGATAPGTAAGLVNGRPRLRSAMPAASAPFYWLFLERGTVDRVQRKTGRHTGKVSPRPWAGPAFEAEGDNAIEAFRLVLARDVEAYANSLPKTVNRGV